MLAADVLYTEEDLEDPGLSCLFLSTLRSIAAAASDACGLVVVLAWEETSARAVAQLRTFWTELESAGFCAIAVPVQELDAIYRRDGIHISILRPLHS